jgi:3-phosphoshikimate 1-carboxyvinyltransferase
MATELRKTGAEIEEGKDFLRIRPPTHVKPATISTYNDHRMAMAFSLLAFANSGSVILDPACTGKTYPEFFSDFLRLGINREGQA